MVFKKGHPDLRKGAKEGGYARDLLENETVKLWIENLGRKSDLTSGVYLRGMNYYCKRMDTDPEKILIDAKENNGDKLQRDFMKFVSIMESEGKKGAYISRYKKVIHSWTKFNNIKFRLIANIENENINENVLDERVPTNEELGKILRKAGLRERVSISLMAFSGLRPQVLGNNEGTDSLRLKDLPEIEISTDSEGKQTVRATKDTLLINVRFNLSKKRFRYHTFLCSEGVKYLLEYLEDRIRSGEKLTGDSPILQYNQETKQEHDVMTTHFLTKAIRSVIRSLGYDWRPYVFRAFFSTGMDIAESKGMVSHSWRQHWMGHFGDIESRYSTNKNIPDDVVEGMRESYAKCSKFLVTESKGMSVDDSIRLLRESTINAIEIYANIKITEEQKEKLFALNTDEFNEELRRLAKSKSQERTNKNQNKIIPERELEGYLNKGWELIKIYPAGDKAVVKLCD